MNNFLSILSNFLQSPTQISVKPPSKGSLENGHIFEIRDGYYLIYDFNVPYFIEHHSLYNNYTITTVDDNFTITASSFNWSLESLVEYYLQYKDDFLDNLGSHKFVFTKKYDAEYRTGVFKKFAVDIPIEKQKQIAREFRLKSENAIFTTTNICPYCQGTLHIIPKARCKCKSCGKFVAVKYDPDKGEIYQMTQENADIIGEKHQLTYLIINSLSMQGIDTSPENVTTNLLQNK